MTFMQIGKGMEVCFYDGGIPRKGETLMERVLTEYRHGDRWKVRKATVVGSPFKRRGQWHVEVEVASTSMPDRPYRETAAARQLVCQWEAFLEVVRLRTEHDKREREAARIAFEAEAKREEVIEAALRARGFGEEPCCFYKGTVTVTLDQMEALLGMNTKEA